jgi:hypothetical protein
VTLIKALGIPLDSQSQKELPASLISKSLKELITSSHKTKSLLLLFLLIVWMDGWMGGWIGGCVSG